MQQINTVAIYTRSHPLTMMQAAPAFHTVFSIFINRSSLWSTKDVILFIFQIP